MGLEVTIETEAWSGLDFEPEALARAAYGAVLARCPSLAAEDEVALQLDADAGVQALNRQFRGKDRPTNVLAFPAPALAVPLDGVPRIRGDVVLALETVRREAVEQGKPVAHHTAHLIVHGLLHLLGHDHQDPLDAGVMEALETRILQELGIPDPYEIGQNGHGERTSDGQTAPSPGRG